jgi:hypothetical protein
MPEPTRSATRAARAFSRGYSLNREGATRLASPRQGLLDPRTISWGLGQPEFAILVVRVEVLELDDFESLESFPDTRRD